MRLPRMMLKSLKRRMTGWKSSWKVTCQNYVQTVYICVDPKLIIKWFGFAEHTHVRAPVDEHSVRGKSFGIHSWRTIVSSATVYVHSRTRPDVIFSRAFHQVVQLDIKILIFLLHDMQRKVSSFKIQKTKVYKLLISFQNFIDWIIFNASINSKLVDNNLHTWLHA